MTKPDREQLAEMLGRNYGQAMSTDPNGPAAKIAARLIDKNQHLAHKEQNNR